MLSYPTGNEFVSLSHINANDASLYALNLLSKQHKGLLEFCADADKSQPFIQPFIYYKKKPLDLTDIEWSQEHYWVPVADIEAPAVDVTIRYVAPPGLKGFAILMEILPADEAELSPKDLVCGIEGRWGDVRQHINLGRDLPGYRCYHEPYQKNGLYLEFEHSPTIAGICVSASNKQWSAIQAGIQKFPKTLTELLSLDGADNEGDVEQGDQLQFVLAAAPEAFDGGARIAFFVGFGQDELSSAAAAAHLDRMGYDEILDSTHRRLQELTLQASDPEVQDAINRNGMFCHYFSTGRTFDTEEFVCVTSRSTDYYGSAAYWDRDALFWTFPCVMQQDQRVGREVLEYALGTQLRNTGVHSRFIDGTILEQGLELDQLCSPVIELVHYVRFTNDYDFPKSRMVQEAVASLRARVLSLKYRNAFLFRTFLNSTDDVPPYSCVTYMNVLAWRFFFDLAFLDEKLVSTATRSVENRNNALRLRREIYTHCIREVNDSEVFAYAVPIDGEELRFDPLNPDKAAQKSLATGIYDDPMGSLLTLPYWGFCKYYDPIYQNTVRLLLSAENPHSHSGKRFDFSGAYHDSSAHGPFVASMANQLLVRINQQKIKNLIPDLALDNGLACESINSDTGVVETGHAMASMAGFWAYAMYRGLAKVGSFGWPEPNPEEIMKTEGAIRLSTIASGQSYPRPVAAGAVEDIGAMPRSAGSDRAHSSPSPRRGPSVSPTAPVLPPRVKGEKALTRGQLDQLHTQRKADIPDDIGNRLPSRSTSRRSYADDED